MARPLLFRNLILAGKFLNWLLVPDAAAPVDSTRRALLPAGAIGQGDHAPQQH